MFEYIFKIKKKSDLPYYDPKQPNYFFPNKNKSSTVKCK